MAATFLFTAVDRAKSFQNSGAFISSFNSYNSSFMRSKLKCITCLYDGLAQTLQVLAESVLVKHRKIISLFIPRNSAADVPSNCPDRFV
jgi:hypothetical protein